MDLEPLDVYKALGEETRYLLFTELLGSGAALSTSELAGRLGLHPNTVRPHLERMREVGLVELEVDGRGMVGRPCHRYRPAPDRRSEATGGHNRPQPAVSRMGTKSPQEDNYS